MKMLSKPEAGERSGQFSSRKQPLAMKPALLELLRESRRLPLEGCRDVPISADKVPAKSPPSQEPLSGPGPGVSAPIPIFKPEPPYTKQARRDRIEGLVALYIFWILMSLFAISSGGGWNFLYVLFMVISYIPYICMH